MHVGVREAWQVAAEDVEDVVLGGRVADEVVAVVFAPADHCCYVCEAPGGYQLTGCRGEEVPIDYW